MSVTFQPGQRVIWMQQHRGGYGYVTPVKAEVIRMVGQRVRIRVWRHDGQPAEKLVKAASLREPVIDGFTPSAHLDETERRPAMADHEPPEWFSQPDEVYRRWDHEDRPLDIARW